MRITLPTGTPASMVEVEGATTALIITPDIFGLRPLFDEMAERFAAEWQMTTVVVEPFPGRELTDDVDQRFAAVPQLDDDAHLEDLIAAADLTGCSRAVLMGFCMGGMYCFKAARSPRFDRIVSFYGMIRLPETWKGPGHREPLAALDEGDADKVLAIIGELDPYTPPDDVAALAETGARIVRYPEAEHGFAHAPERPAHRPDDAADAFARARRWFERSP